LDPIDGKIQGAPGQTIGWGFSLSSDPTNFISVIGSLLLDESDPTLGVYTDFIGAEGGPDGGVLPPGDPAWAQVFDSSLGTGAGSYTIDPFVPIGAIDSGNLRVLFEVYSGDPRTCGSCFLFADGVQVPFQIEVTPAPEPTTLWILGGSLLLLGRLRRDQNLQ
jgi:hypothetical protein